MNWRAKSGRARVICPWTHRVADAAHALANAVEQAPETADVRVGVVDFTAEGTVLRVRFKLATRDPEARQRVALAIANTAATFQRGPR